MVYFYWWLIFGVGAIILILLQKKWRNNLWETFIYNNFVDRNFYQLFWGLVLLYVLAPFTIPRSIRALIFKRQYGEPDNKTGG